ncbi:MAG: amidohydrolase [Eubacteriales bacterium]
MLIINARIYTMDKERIIEDGYLRFDNGKITALGQMSHLTPQTGADFYDAEGGWVLPGFIDAHSHIGLYGDALGFESDDLNEATDPSTPNISAMDAVNPMDRCFAEALESGITCVHTGPGSSNPIGGQSLVMKTYGKRLEKMVLKHPAAIKFALGENPKTSFHGKNMAPDSRMATGAIIRDNLLKAQKYMQDKLDFESGGDEEAEEPEFDSKSEALIPLLKGHIPAHFHAHRADDIFTAVRIAGQFGLKYIIVHCTDGHQIAEELRDDKIKAFVGPIICDRSKPELRMLDIKNAAVLHKSGAEIAIITDHPVIPQQYLALSAAVAVKGGLDEYEALRAITINPASMLGVADRVGSLAVGKDADIVVFDGSPLVLSSSLKRVYVDGKEVLRDVDLKV